MQPQTGLCKVIEPLHFGCTISENNGYKHLMGSSLIDLCKLFEYATIETFFVHSLPSYHHM
jgi:hypothetical protein